MKLDTRSFGTIEVQEETIINFNSGIPGFPDNRKFIILTDEEMQSNNSDFCWLQSIDDPTTAFPLINTTSIYNNYSPTIDKEELGDLINVKEEDIALYNIVVIPEDVDKTTVNLKAPVLIDTKNKVGKQVIASNDYPIRHLLKDKIKD